MIYRHREPGHLKALRKSVFTACCLAAFSATGFAQQSAPSIPNPALFDESTLLEVELTGPVDSTIDDREERAERPFTLRHEGEEWQVQVRVRGKSRSREKICDFPPLRFRFENAEGIFAGQSKLKLVTHCKSADSGDSDAMEEYATYRIFNLLTPTSYRVRPVRVTYNDTGNRTKSKAATRYGFLIESADNLAQRTGSGVPELEGVRLSRMDPDHMALVYVFQYLVGNTDWSLVTGDGSSYCCHNGLLLESNGQLRYVPYDFDLAGLVNASYAKPDPSLRLRNVRKRRYLGFCTESETLFKAIRKVASLEDAVYEVMRTTPGLSERRKDSAIDYLEQFFKKAQDQEALHAQFEKQCKSP